MSEEKKLADLESEIRAELRHLGAKLESLSTRVAIAETNIKEIYTTLSGIKSNTTWILRLIIGSMILALLGLVYVKGGK